MKGYNKVFVYQYDGNNKNRHKIGIKLKVPQRLRLFVAFVAQALFGIQNI